VPLQLCSLATWITLTIPLTWYVGAHPRHDLTYSELAFGYKFGYVGVFWWAAAMPAIKISIALTLLRFLQDRGWRIFLYAVVAFLGCMALGNELFLLLQCRPLRYAWDLAAPAGSCWQPGKIKAVSTTISSLSIASDIVLALLPLTFLVRLHRPLRERILLAILMATGLFAGVASLRKTLIVLRYGNPAEDIMDLNVAIPTWTCIEEFAAVVAGCLPSLKLPIQHALARLGYSVKWDSGSSSGGTWARYAVSRTHPASKQRNASVDGYPLAPTVATTYTVHSMPSKDLSLTTAEKSRTWDRVFDGADGRSVERHVADVV
jgi:hypothetical protein